MEHCPPAPFDKRRLKLAIRQLLDNALKYTPAETPVQLGAQMKDGVLTIDVTDYGNGILGPVHTIAELR
jgi:signal transduction histidine kinase